jgi:hypothetical protein
MRFMNSSDFFKGGLPTVCKTFMADNSEVDVKNSLCHLLFGPSDFITRMGQCIFDPGYSLRYFSRACVQELCGWINADAPVCNGRTVTRRLKSPTRRSATRRISRSIDALAHLVPERDAGPPPHPPPFRVRERTESVAAHCARAVHRAAERMTAHGHDNLIRTM